MMEAISLNLSVVFSTYMYIENTLEQLERPTLALGAVTVNSSKLGLFAYVLFAKTRSVVQMSIRQLRAADASVLTNNCFPLLLDVVKCVN